MEQFNMQTIYHTAYVYYLLVYSEVMGSVSTSGVCYLDLPANIMNYASPLLT